MQHLDWCIAEVCWREQTLCHITLVILLVRKLVLTYAFRAIVLLSLTPHCLRFILDQLFCYLCN